MHEKNQSLKISAKRYNARIYSYLDVNFAGVQYRRGRYKPCNFYVAAGIIRSSGTNQLIMVVRYNPRIKPPIRGMRRLSDGRPIIE
jgi:hypothetical protein